MKLIFVFALLIAAVAASDLDVCYNKDAASAASKCSEPLVSCYTSTMGKVTEWMSELVKCAVSLATDPKACDNVNAKIAEFTLASCTCYSPYVSCIMKALGSECFGRALGDVYGMCNGWELACSGKFECNIPEEYVPKLVNTYNYLTKLNATIANIQAIDFDAASQKLEQWAEQWGHNMTVTASTISDWVQKAVQRTEATAANVVAAAQEIRDAAGTIQATIKAQANTFANIVNEAGLTLQNVKIVANNLGADAAKLAEKALDANLLIASTIVDYKLQSGSNFIEIGKFAEPLDVCYNIAHLPAEVKAKVENMALSYYNAESAEWVKSEAATGVQVTGDLACSKIDHFTTTAITISEGSQSSSASSVFASAVFAVVAVAVALL